MTHDEHNGRRYTPRPIATDGVTLSLSIIHLVELLAENAHDVWALERLSQGWSHGHERCDEKKTHPCLINYSDLPDSEKEYDRKLVLSTLKTIQALGYRIHAPVPMEEG